MRRPREGRIESAAAPPMAAEMPRGLDQSQYGARSGVPGPRPVALDPEAATPGRRAGRLADITRPPERPRAVRKATRPVSRPTTARARTCPAGVTACRVPSNIATSRVYVLWIAGPRRWSPARALMRARRRQTRVLSFVPTGSECGLDPGTEQRSPTCRPPPAASVSCLRRSSPRRSRNT